MSHVDMDPGHGDSASRAPRVVCVGSLNYDITVFVPRRPLADETIHGDRVAEFRGGKGSNQIVAAARLGATAAMVGCVGADSRGDFLIAGLDLDGVDHHQVVRVDAPTGVAIITVDPHDVSIVVVASANALMSAELVDQAADAIADADVLLLQGEVPASAARRAAELARASGTRVVFNPAPFNDVAPVVIPFADVVIVNRQEAAELERAGCVLSDIEMLVTTLGAGGCEVKIAGRSTHVEPFEADFVDPTGAGDCFAAALAVGLAEAMTPADAARFANAAGSLAVEGEGAQPALPHRAQVIERLSRGEHRRA
jgi:ribokinase